MNLLKLSPILLAFLTVIPAFADVVTLRLYQAESANDPNQKLLVNEALITSQDPSRPARFSNQISTSFVKSAEIDRQTKITTLSMGTVEHGTHAQIKSDGKNPNLFHIQFTHRDLLALNTFQAFVGFDEAAIQLPAVSVHSFLQSVSLPFGQEIDVSAFDFGAESPGSPPSMRMHYRVTALRTN